MPRTFPGGSGRAHDHDFPHRRIRLRSGLLDGLLGAVVEYSDTAVTATIRRVGDINFDMRSCARRGHHVRGLGN